MEITDDRVSAFIDKPSGDNGYINDGFFVLSPKVLDYIEGDETVWEQELMQALARAGQLAAFRHNGFWQPMDTLREKKEALWESGQAEWKLCEPRSVLLARPKGARHRPYRLQG